jgi:hypothetical protein
VLHPRAKIVGGPGTCREIAKIPRVPKVTIEAHDEAHDQLFDAVPPCFKGFGFGLVFQLSLLAILAISFQFPAHGPATA